MDTPERDAADRADMQRLASGQSEALNDLMERHAARLFGFLFRMLGHEEDAGDLAQETFVRVFQHCGRFQPDARFSTWLYTIAANLARNHQRWRMRHRDLPLEAPVAGGELALQESLASTERTPDASAAREDQAVLVRNAVHRLPTDLREAIILCEWEELSLQDAAQVLHTTPKAVESRLYRARQKLRETLVALL